MGTEKTWCGGVDFASDPGDVCQCAEPCHVDEGYSKEMEVKISVHQGWVLNPLLFIILLEALSCEFCSGVPWEDFYADKLLSSLNHLRNVSGHS